MKEEGASRMRFRISTLVLVIALGNSAAFAWGPDGHRIVCQIAFSRLDAAAQAEVTRLAHTYRAPNGDTFPSFPDGCTFPDDARGKARDGVDGYARFHQLDNWHFLNLPRTSQHVEESACNDDCVLKGIAFHGSSLKSATSDNDRAEALFFLGHWVGDVHEPLHVSYADDLGGNTIKPIKGGFYRSPHLHAVWDSGIIAAAKGAEGWKEFATELAGQITSADATSWAATAPADWAEESYAITISPDVRYCRMETANGTAVCAPDHPSSGRTLKSAYQNEFAGDVETRLQKAGVRLAAFISAALGAPSASAAASTNEHTTVATSAAASPFVPTEGEPIVHSADEDHAGPAIIYPDTKENPGAVDPAVTQDNIAETICSKKFLTSSIRPPSSFTTKLKKQQMHDTYGDTVAQTKASLGGSNFDDSKCKLHSADSRCYEEDHIISLQNGGAPSDSRNLWPEPYNTSVQGDHVGAREKDKIENFVHNGICLDVADAKFSAGPKPRKRLTLQDGQRILAIDWYACYQQLADGNDCEAPQ
jgi:hypothetical protein